MANIIFLIVKVKGAAVIYFITRCKFIKRTGVRKWQKFAIWKFSLNVFKFFMFFFMFWHSSSSCYAIKRGLLKFNSIVVYEIFTFTSSMPEKIDKGSAFWRGQFQSVKNLLIIMEIKFKVYRAWWLVPRSSINLHWKSFLSSYHIMRALSKTFSRRTQSCPEPKLMKGKM